MQPKVSIIIPAYNAGRYLDRCLGSLIGQSYGDFDAIVIDDGSTDDTPRVLSRFAQGDKRVRLIRQCNLGAAVARNKGIGLADGEFLMFVDADDYLDEDCLEQYIDAQQEFDCDVVCGGYRRPNAKGVIQSEVRINPDSEWAYYSMTAGCAKLYRTDYVRSRGFRFFEGAALGEDLFFTIPAISAASSIRAISYVGYNYYLNEVSASSSMTGSAGQEFDRLISYILDEEDRLGVKVEGILLHVFVRQAAWYLFYTSRTDSKDELQRNYERFVGLLDQRLPGWRSDSFARPGHPTGDTFKSRVAAWLFARHPHLFLLALSIYGGQR